MRIVCGRAKTAFIKAPAQNQRAHPRAVGVKPEKGCDAACALGWHIASPWHTLTRVKPSHEVRLPHQLHQSKAQPTPITHGRAETTACCTEGATGAKLRRCTGTPDMGAVVAMVPISGALLVGRDRCCIRATAAWGPHFHCLLHRVPFRKVDGKENRVGCRASLHSQLRHSS